MIVNGPYEGAPGIPSFGTFRVGSLVTVTETSGSLVSITSPTGTPVVDLVNRRGTLLMGNIGGFNELVFTNRERPPDNPALQPRVLNATGASACPGTSTLVSLSGISQGDEISVNVVVQFDQTKLSNPVVQIGAGALADGFVLNVNYSNVASGLIGITLTSPTNTPFTAGSRELVKIAFNILPLVTGDALITFGGPTQTLVNTQNDVLPTVPGQSTVSIGGASCTTSADVSLSGRVISEQGTGLRNATVTITDQSGKSRSVITSSLGYYQIDDVKAGGTYVITASSRRFRFASRVIEVSDSLSNLDFVGME